MEWLPTLSDRTGPAYRRIVEALAADIASGRLRRGQQLPTHRALAKALGLDLTTVTRAYNEAQRTGLTEGRVGLGTFVANEMSPSAPPAAPLDFDLSMNLPPQPIEADLEGRIARGIAALQRETGFGAYLNYREAGGSPEERGTAAEWLRSRIPSARGDRLLVCAGTQTSLACLLLALTSPGDLILTEALTYPGIKAAAGYAGVRLAGVAMDRDGLIPDALEAALQNHAPKAVYLVPTIHNPTTATLSPARRERIAEIIRRSDAVLIEDDAYGLLAPDAIPMAALIPEHTYFLASLSKCISPGLRVSFMLSPDPSAAGRAAGALRATIQMPVPLMVALVTRWIGDGSADAIVAAIRAEAAARQKIAARALSGRSFSAHPNGHHVWVPLPDGWSRAEFASHVQRQGLAVVSSEAFSVGPSAAHAVRVALGAARDRAQLSRALEVLAVALASSPVEARVV